MADLAAPQPPLFTRAVLVRAVARGLAVLGLAWWIYDLQWARDAGLPYLLAGATAVSTILQRGAVRRSARLATSPARCALGVGLAAAALHLLLLGGATAWDEWARRTTELLPEAAPEAPVDLAGWVSRAALPAFAAWFMAGLVSALTIQERVGRPLWLAGPALPWLLRWAGPAWVTFPLFAVAGRYSLSDLLFVLLCGAVAWLPALWALLLLDMLVERVLPEARVVRDEPGPPPAAPGWPGSVDVRVVAVRALARMAPAGPALYFVRTEDGFHACLAILAGIAGATALERVSLRISSRQATSGARCALMAGLACTALQLVAIGFAIGRSRGHAIVIDPWVLSVAWPSGGLSAVMAGRARDASLGKSSVSGSALGILWIVATGPILGVLDLARGGPLEEGLLLALTSPLLFSFFGFLAAGALIVIDGVSAWVVDDPLAAPPPPAPDAPAVVPPGGPGPA